MQIRPEQPADHPAITALLRRCFPGEPVDVMVEALRAGPTYLGALCLVAVDQDVTGDAVVTGFVMLSTVGLERLGENGFEVGEDLLCLAPLAVQPAASGRGVARALVGAALRRAEHRAREAFVVLEGDPALYSRFGFVAASEFGLGAPSERIPPRAFQAYPLRPNESAPTGRVVYSPPFWEVVEPGLPVEGVTFLDALQAQCRKVEAALTPEALAATVPGCPGWVVADAVEHLARIHRLVLAWLTERRRPRQVPPPVDDAPLALQFARGWRDLHTRLGAEAADAPAPTWCAYDGTVGFWRRRMAHEHAIHAHDVLEALGRPWSVPDDLALDGVDEALRLWLGTRSGTRVGGDGSAVRLAAVDADDRVLRHWTVARHDGVVEVLDARVLTTDSVVDAEVRAAPSDLYLWVWGRAAAVRTSGTLEAIAGLTAALNRVLG